jgi:hypothetical protein
VSAYTRQWMVEWSNDPSSPTGGTTPGERKGDNR